VRVVVVLVLALLAAPAIAGPTQDLDSGRRSFKQRDYQSAKATLNTLLYPRIELAQNDEIWECRVLLGASLYHLGDRQRAVKEFELAMQLDIERAITTNNYAEDVVRLFDDTKARVKADLELKKKIREQEEREKRIKEYLDTIGVYETNSYVRNFLPFGAGQFQNKHTTKGYIVAGTMAATGATSLTIFMYLGLKYGLSSNNVPLVEGPRVRQLQQLEIVTGAAFFATWIYAIIDGIVHYTPQRRIKGDDTLIPTDLIDPSKPVPKAPPKKKTSLRDRLRIGPMLTPTGIGIGLGLEN
jgi:tetratricopeptide (TPR) repeat protein